MSGSFCDFLEAEILDHVFGAATYTPPATLYIGLSNGDPLDDGSGISEPSGNGYARIAVTNNTTNFPAATGTSPTNKTNGVTFSFPKATPAGWGTVSHYFISDAASAGNIMAHADLTAGSRTVDPNEILSFPAGDFDITLD